MTHAQGLVFDGSRTGMSWQATLLQSGNRADHTIKGILIAERIVDPKVLQAEHVGEGGCPAKCLRGEGSALGRLGGYLQTNRRIATVAEHRRTAAVTMMDFVAAQAVKPDFHPSIGCCLLYTSPSPRDS